MDEYWEHMRISNKERAEYDVKVWSEMIDKRKEMLEKLTDLSEFMKQYPESFVKLQLEVNKATACTIWAIKESRLNRSWAKRRLEGSQP